MIAATEDPGCEGAPRPAENAPFPSVRRSLRGGFLASSLQWVLRALWDLVLPALLAATVMRFLVPSVAEGFPGVVARIGKDHPVGLGATLFLLFVGLGRYWRFSLPGGRYASSLPAHLVTRERDGDALAFWARTVADYEMLASPRAQRWMKDKLAAGAKLALAEQFTALRAAVEATDREAARAASSALAALAGPLFALQRRRSTLGTLGAVGLAGLAALALRAEGVEPYVILSGSMLPTLEPGDRIAGNPFAYRSPFAGTESERVPRRGDVVIFRTESVAVGPRAGLPEILVKRVIGVPGDRITMSGGAPIINGWRVPSCDAGEYLYVPPDGEGRAFRARLRVEFLEDQAYLTVQGAAVPFAGYVVERGEVFVLGDNRSNSIDSRAYHEGRGGGVPLRGIDARGQWFLTGTHRSGNTDFSRLLHPIDGLQTRLRVEGVDGSSYEDAIAKCLASAPKDTRPPAPDRTPVDPHSEPSR